MPTLYVVPTPIGNLEDITLRALRVLREVPVVLAEDTRHTRRLTSHFDIKTRLVSYHQHNKRSRLPDVLRWLDQGDVALVSDSGMPSLSDPGFELIVAAYEHGIAVDVLPGSSAVTTALVAAALPAPGFLFLGFLPRRQGDRRRQIREVASLPYALVLYEAPHRLAATLRDLELELGDRSAVLARELTKLHQEVDRSSVRALRTRVEREGVRGEITLVLAGEEQKEPEDAGAAQRALGLLRQQGGSWAEAQALARRHGLARNEAYKLWLETGADTDR